jgi:hypothetical protein
MQFKKWLFHSIGLIILYLTFWCLLIISGFLKNHPDDELSNFLPQSTKYAVRIYTNNILKTCFEELFFYQKDETTQEKFEEFAQKIISNTDSAFTQTSTSKEKFQGIDLYNDIIFFEFLENKTTYSGILCHVTDSIKFSNNSKDKNFIKLCKESIGIILQHDQGRTDQKSLGQRALKILSFNGSKKLNHKRNSPQALLDIYLSVNNGEQGISELKMEVNADPEKISIVGNVNPSLLKSNNTLSYHLQPKNLNLYLKDIPEQMNLAIGKWFDQNKFPKLEFEEMQINYEGLDIGFSTTNLAVIPKFEAIFKTKNKTKIREYLSDTTILNAIGGKLDSDFVSINSNQYFFEQLDSCSFYIGNNHKPVYEKRLITDPLSIRGKLSHLTNIQTGGMDFLLNFVPVYSSLNNYFLRIESFNLKITEDIKQNHFEASMVFKPAHNAFFESLLLLNDLQELKTLMK